MAGKRANGEGSIYQLPDGRWRVTVSVCSFGRMKRISRTRKRRADCVALLDELRAKIGSATAENVGTLREYLARWHQHITQNLADNTLATYERAIRLHINPRLGSVKMSKITPMIVSEFKDAMKADEVKPRAAQAAYQCLRSALQHAVFPFRLIQTNPCDGIKPPSHVKRKMNPFTSQEVRDILESCDGTRWHALYSVAFGCGLRIGELFALEWSDVDWSESRIHINKQLLDAGGKTKIVKPKTKSSVRWVEMSKSVRESLRKHRADQIVRGMSGCEIVFPTLNGRHLGRANFSSDEWIPRLLRCGLTHRGFHNTRHTFATLLLLAGVPVAIVTKSLGHSNPSITYATYSHTLPTSEGITAETMQRIIG